MRSSRSVHQHASDAIHARSAKQGCQPFVQAAWQAAARSGTTEHDLHAGCALWLLEVLLAAAVELLATSACR